MTMTKSDFKGLLALCLIILILQLIILAYLLKKYLLNLPKIPTPVINFKATDLTLNTEPTIQIEEGIYDDVFVQHIAQNDGYFSELTFQGGFFPDTGTSDQATHSTGENQ